MDGPTLTMKALRSFEMLEPIPVDIVFVAEHLNLTLNGRVGKFSINPLNAELNPICHLLALLGGATIVVVSRLRVKSLLPFARITRRCNYSSR